MSGKRLPLFVALLAIMVVVVGGAYFIGGADDSVCPPGKEPVREFTTNKSRKLECRTVEKKSE